MSRSISSLVARLAAAAAVAACLAACLSPAGAPCGEGFCAAGEVCVDGRCGFCGDGIVQASTGEACDEGAGNSTEPDVACRPDCQPPRCGDGTLDALRGEACDEGGQNSNVDPDRCRSYDCKPARCGDGVEDSGEESGCLEDGGEVVDVLPSPGVRVVPADLDRDGLTDLVVLERDSSRLSVHYRTLAGYEAATIIAVETPIDLSIGDLDGQHDLDLLVRTGGAVPQLVPFTARDRLFTAHAPIELAPTDRFAFLADLDDDLGDDLVIIGTLALGPSLSYAQLRSGDHTGGFAEGVNTTLTGNPQAYAFATHPLGDPTLLHLVMAQANTLVTLRAEAGELVVVDTASLGASELVEQPAGAPILAAGYLSADLGPTVLLITTGGTEMWRTDPSGVMFRDLTLGGEPISVAFMDLTGDIGVEGVIGEADSVQLVVRDAAGVHRPQLQLSLPAPALELAVGDLDLDGIADLVVGDAVGPRVRLLRGGDGPFGVSQQVPVYTTLAADLVVGPLSGAPGAEIVRCDDLGVFVYEDPAISGRVTSSNLDTTPTKRLFIADVDADGLNDVIAMTDFGELRVHFKSAASAGYVTKGGEFCSFDSLLVSQVTSDLTLDAVCWDKNGELEVFPGGASGFKKPALLSTLGHGVDDMVSADLDGDGQNELVSVSGAGIHVAAPLGGGLFAPSVLLDATPGLRVLAGHIDLDGVVDLAVLSRDGAEVLVLLGRGAAAPVLASRHAFSGQVTALTLADFNGDGAADLFFGNGAGTARALLGRGDGTFARPARAGASKAIFVTVGDVTGDGNTDVFWSDGTDAFFLPSRLGPP